MNYEFWMYIKIHFPIFYSAILFYVFSNHLIYQKHLPVLTTITMKKANTLYICVIRIVSASFILAHMLDIA